MLQDGGSCPPPPLPLPPGRAEIGGLLHCPSANLSGAIAAVGKVPPAPRARLGAKRGGAVADAAGGEEVGAGAGTWEGGAAAGAEAAGTRGQGLAAAGAGASATLRKPAIRGANVHRLIKPRLKKAAAAAAAAGTGGSTAAATEAR